MQDDTFIIAIGNEKITVSKKLTEASQYLHNIMSLGIDEQEIQIDQDIIDKTTFEHFLTFCQINNYKEPNVLTPIRTNNLEDVIDTANYNFIKQFSPFSQQFKKLLKASEFFVCKGLQKLITAVLACAIYFEDNQKAYEQKKISLGITKNISFEDEERFKSLISYDNESK